MSAEHLAQILSPPIKRTLSDEVVERLRRAIIGGHLAPDEQLRENLLAESMGVSRGPIREALSRLEREGLVINRPNGRSFVARLSRQDVEEVYSLRQVLERLAVGYVCQKAGPAEWAEMQAVVDEMTARIAQGITEQEAAELDLRFHDILYRAAGHQRLLGYWTTLRPQIYVFLLSRNVASSDFRDSAVEGHQVILDAIKARDEARAQALIEGHLNFAYDRVIGSYRQVADNQG
ncbi:MAG: GntR family transcriptional regulator [Chloroflexi bacterium]|nr:GntR family transcriptional regulator [Chloroflexota bacterium]